MSRRRNSAFDLFGITLGVLVILVVIASVAMIARGRMFNAQWSLPAFHGNWDGRWFSIGGALREEKDEQVPAGVTELEVHNVGGSIDISGSPDARVVSVHSVKTAPFQAAMENVRVEIEKRGNRLVVAEKHDSGFIMRNGTVNFRIVVPSAVKVIEAHSVSGEITLQGIGTDIDQTLSTISGGISTEYARNLDVTSTSGPIHFVSAGSSVNVRSVSGPIDGEIRSLSRTGSARLTTVSGSVSVAAFASLDATLSLHSLSGPVSCGFPLVLTEQKNNRLSGRVGDGAASLEVGTVSGSISISRL